MSTVGAQLRSETFEWSGPAAVTRAMPAMSGLAYLSGIRDAVVMPPAMESLLQAELINVDRGQVELLCSPTDALQGGVLDAGLAGLVLETAIGCAVRSTLRAGATYSALDSTVRFTRAILPSRGPLIAFGRVVSRASGIALAEGWIVDERNQVLATSAASLLVTDTRGMS